MKTAIPDSDYQTEFTLTFRNKITMEKSNIDDIFSESNRGEWEITELIIYSYSYKHNIKIRLDIDKKSDTSIYYSIEGKDRNWVFLTKSFIDERIKAVTKFRFTEMAFFLMIPFVIVYFFSFLFLLLKLIFPSHVDIALPLGDLILSLLMLILIGIAGITYITCFHPNSFYWGDYKQILEKRRTRGKFILGSVLLTLILGIIIGVIANYLTIRIGIGH